MDVDQIELGEPSWIAAETLLADVSAAEAAGKVIRTQANPPERSLVADDLLHEIGAEDQLTDAIDESPALSIVERQPRAHQRHHAQRGQQARIGGKTDRCVHARSRDARER